MSGRNLSMDRVGYFVKNTRTALIVTGMHRSGTSALARVLSILGVDLPRHILPAQPDNPTGFWEPSELVTLHDEMMERVDSSWDDYSAKTPLMENQLFEDNYKERYIDTINREYEGSGLFVIKDPRLARFVPQTVTAMNEMGIVPKFIIMIRNPLEVASSLKVRDNFIFKKSFLLWLDYTLTAELHTRNCTRTLVLYDDLLQDWKTVLSNIENDLSIQFPGWTGGNEKEVSDFLDIKQRHHTCTFQELQVNPDIVDWVKTTYETVTKLTRKIDRDQYPVLDHIWNEYSVSSRAFGPVIRKERQYADIYAMERDETRSRLDEAMSHISELEHEIQHLHKRNEDERAQSERKALEIDRLRNKSESLQKSINKIKSSTSWKVTAPIRKLRYLKHALHKVARSSGRITRGDVSIGREVLLLDQKLLHKGLDWDLLQEYPGDVGIKDVDEPDISIIIPVYGQYLLTIRCLAALSRQRTSYKYEIIVIDDASPDDTEKFLSDLDGIRYIRNNENLGFIHSCNKASEIARSPFLLILNNDTMVQADALDELMNTFMQNKNVGMVGAKLLYEDGTLQEAGGIVWADATAWNFGRGDDPCKPEYNYVREADYCSGAAIMIPTELWNEMNGFDTYYTRAYYEDTDLAFRVRDAGYRVLYQPFSRILHLEGKSSGLDLNAGEKRHQVINRKKFYDRWHRILHGYRQNGDKPELEKDRYVKGRILIIDARTPMEDHDSGSVDVINHIRMLNKIGYKSTFIPQSNYLYYGKHTDKLQRLGVECIYKPYCNTLIEHLENQGQYYDYVIIHRVMVFKEVIDDVERLCPNARIIFNTTDLHFLRQQRQAALENNDNYVKEAEQLRNIEVGMMRRANDTIVVSSYEKDIIEQSCPDISVHYLPLIRDIPGSLKPFGSRRDMAFIGGFQHPPNIDAMLYFVENVWPHIHQNQPDANLIIAGSSMPDEIFRLESREGVIPQGYVDDLGSFFGNIRLTVAPLRYGAGAKGKVVSSMCHGVPVVASPIAAEGIGCEHRKNVYVAETVDEWIEGVIDIYNKEQIWKRYSDAGLTHMHQNHSLESGVTKMREILGIYCEQKESIRSA